MKTTLEKFNEVFETPWKFTTPSLKFYRERQERLNTLHTHALHLLTLCEEEQRKHVAEKIDYCKRVANIQPLSHQWFQKRQVMFTASSDIYNMSGGNGLQRVVNKKLGKAPKFKGNIHTRHGQKYEDIAKGILCSRHDLAVAEVGLLEHEDIKHLGATPDGILSNGKLIEIKVPSTRKIDGKVKSVYFSQMQTQMEVFDYDEVVFFECRIEEYPTRDAYDKDVLKSCIFGMDPHINDKFISPKTRFSEIKVPKDRRTKNGLEKGLLGRIGFERCGEGNVYIYPPMWMNTDQQYKWLLKKQKEMLKKNVDLRIDYWKLMKSSEQIIQRNRDWWHNKKNIPEKIKQGWDLYLESKDETQKKEANNPNPNVEKTQTEIPKNEVQTEIQIEPKVNTNDDTLEQELQIYDGIDDNNQVSSNIPPSIDDNNQTDAIKTETHHVTEDSDDDSSWCPDDEELKKLCQDLEAFAWDSSKTVVNTYHLRST